jgi:hypothetical protein
MMLGTHLHEPDPSPDRARRGAGALARPRQLLRARLLDHAAIKIVLGSILASHYLRDLFTPFVNYFIESRGANPWALSPRKAGSTRFRIRR